MGCADALCVKTLDSEWFIAHQLNTPPLPLPPNESRTLMIPPRLAQGEEEGVVLRPPRATKARATSRYRAAPTHDIPPSPTGFGLASDRRRCERCEPCGSKSLALQLYALFPN